MGSLVRDTNIMSSNTHSSKRGLDDFLSSDFDYGDIPKIPSTSQVASPQKDIFLDLDASFENKVEHNNPTAQAGIVQKCSSQETDSSPSCVTSLVSLSSSYYNNTPTSTPNQKPKSRKIDDSPNESYTPLKLKDALLGSSGEDSFNPMDDALLKSIYNTDVSMYTYHMFFVLSLQIILFDLTYLHISYSIQFDENGTTQTRDTATSHYSKMPTPACFPTRSSSKHVMPQATKDTPSHLFQLQSEQSTAAEKKEPGQQLYVTNSTEKSAVSKSKEITTFVGYLQQGDTGISPTHLQLWTHHIVPVEGISKGDKTSLACRGCLFRFGDAIATMEGTMRHPGDIKNMIRTVGEWPHVRTCKNLPEDVTKEYQRIASLPQPRKKRKMSEAMASDMEAQKEREAKRCIDGPNGITFLQARYCGPAADYKL